MVHWLRCYGLTSAFRWDTVFYTTETAFPKELLMMDEETVVEG